jgi:hypothetical protein
MAVHEYPISAKTLEQVVIRGDLAGVSDEHRALYYGQLCQSLGLNPLSQPFSFLRLGNKEIPYATRNCTDQLRHIHKIGLQILSREIVNDLYVVTARATLPDGRTDEEIGAVPIKGKSGDDLANAMMKASTKAKRRVTLSIVGLSILDESEIESLPRSTPATPHPPEPAPVAAPVAAPAEAIAEAMLGSMIIDPNSPAGLGRALAPAPDPAPTPATAGLTPEIITTLPRSSVVNKIMVRLRELAPGSTPTAIEDRKTYMQEAFGKARWPEVEALGLTALRQGLTRLLAMAREAPPEADDVPLGEDAEAPLAAIGAETEADRLAAGADPPSLQVGDDGYLAAEVVRALEGWALAQGQGAVYTDLLAPCPREADRLLVTPSQGERLIAAVDWAAAHEEAADA